MRRAPSPAEKFERFETTFVGAGETLSAALAALLATGVELHAAVGEALAFLDQALDAGFRPGMGNVIPDRFFWALPEEEEGEPGDGEASTAEADATTAPRTRAISIEARHEQRGTLRARPARHPGRRQFAGARVPRRRRHATLHRPGRGRLHGRRRGQALHRLHRLVGPDDPRPPPSRRRGSGPPRGRRGSLVRGTDRARDRAGRGDPSPCAEHGAGPSRQLRNGSGDERAAPRPRRDRAQRHRQVRGLLPRPCRRAARQGRLGPGHVRPSDQCRGARSCRPAHAGPRIQQRRAARGGVRLARAADRLRDDRADRRQHEFRARQHPVHAPAARAVQQPRRPAGVRRGDGPASASLSAAPRRSTRHRSPASRPTSASSARSSAAACRWRLSAASVR